jgi:phosphatidylglycerol lysyltransferase
VRTPDLDIDRARRLVLAHGWNATCYQILNPGFQLWFSEAGDAVAGYVEYGHTRIIGGAPVCPRGRLASVAEELEARNRADRRRTCYFAAEARLEKVYRTATDHATMVLGSQPCWNPSDWPRRIAWHASLRAQLNRAANKGVVVERWPSSRAHNHPELRRCLQEWLATRGLPPMHFLIEPETLSRVFDRKVLVARRDARVTAFLVASPIPARSGWLVEQVVRGSGAVNGTSEMLIDAAVREMIADGSTYVSLGLVPLASQPGSTVHTDPMKRNPAWFSSFMTWLRAHGQRYYKVKGLESFKAKFGPDRWEPVYAIVDEERVRPSVLYAVAAAFAQGSPVALLGRGFLNVLRSTCRSVGS